MLEIILSPASDWSLNIKVVLTSTNLRSNTGTAHITTAQFIDYWNLYAKNRSIRVQVGVLPLKRGFIDSDRKEYLPLLRNI